MISQEPVWSMSIPLLCGSMLWDPRVLIRKTFIEIFWTLKLTPAQCCCRQLVLMLCYLLCILLGPSSNPTWHCGCQEKDCKRPQWRHSFSELLLWLSCTQCLTHRLHSKFSILLYLDEEDMPWRTYIGHPNTCIDIEKIGFSRTQSPYL